MAHFAKLDQNYVVVDVIVINNEVVGNLPFQESEPIGVAFCQSLYGSTTEWKQTSYSGAFRKNFASAGYTYDPILDAFIPPQPGAEWTLNVETCRWVSPAGTVWPMPAPGYVQPKTIQPEPLLDGLPPKVI